MSAHETEDAMGWAPTWTQAVTDCRGEDDEPPFDDVTVRMTVPASIGGSQVRVELSNRFADESVRIGRCAIGIGGQFAEVSFDGQPSTEIAVGESRWSDPAHLAVSHGDQVVVDVYLPDPTPYATANGFTFDRSLPGDFAGSPEFPLDGSASALVDASREFPATDTGTTPEPDGTGWSLPAGGPFLRTVEVAGADAKAVVVCLGSSSTAMGWPQYTAALLPADAKIAIVNRGIAGNRIRLDAPRQTPSWGRAGLSRFDEDVLATHGVTHLVIAYNSNDWGLPGGITSLDEMPTVAQLIDGYRELVERARKEGLTVVLATVTPLDPQVAGEPGREDFRLAVNDWIRTSGHEFVDFDTALRSQADPSRLQDGYAAPDHTHPNVNGSKRLAQVMAEALARLPLQPANP
ncbi:GDSL-type esterase/lipase family protein [Streptomyces cylindrosporus]|uniref:GDSL-type esterase/lipase family protein n=1 Tax=Streptomyces cylindrosporus TaxID=2927583 RepID=A0ABS9Y488_9ACTN|nr:GDSL-type esterase/lipase family protein [Streptomyces cylindrosporus]MCI3270766.1 GDSL-type esterase/lipase family protein [Streptomyces cylindrosporus]